MVLLKRCFYFLLLMAVPCQLMASDWDDCQSRLWAAGAAGLEGNMAINATNRKGITEEEKRELLETAKACYERTIMYLNQNLANIEAKSPRRQKRKWRVRMKQRLPKDIEEYEGRIRAINVVLEVIQTNTMMKEAKQLYEACEKSFIDLTDETREYERLGAVAEINKALEVFISAYRESEVLAKRVQHLIDTVPIELDEGNSEVAKGLLEVYATAIDRLEQEIESRLNQKKAIEERFQKLQHERLLCQEHNLVRRDYELACRAFNTLQVLAPMCTEEEWTLWEGEKQTLQDQIMAFEACIDSERLSDIPDFEPTFQQKQQIRRAALFEDEICPLIQVGTSTPPQLYTEHFYQHVIRQKQALMGITIKVLEEGCIVYEEALNLPSTSVLTWHHYLAEDKGLITSTQELTQRFGIELRVQCIGDRSGQFALLLSIKADQPRYQLLIESDQAKPLYNCHFIRPPPWQLYSLCKPGKGLSYHLAPVEQSRYQKAHEGGMVGNDGTTTDSNVLDQLVLELDRDPLLIAQYVQNEIELVNDSYDNHSLISRRSPLMTYLSGRGTALEQCQLLVCLLKGAGYEDHVYLFKGFCKLEDTYAKCVLHRISEEKQYSCPWVMMCRPYGIIPISFFPWLKEVQVSEGFDLYSQLPQAYAGAHRWLHHYLTGDEALSKCIGPDHDDTVATVFLGYLQQTLRDKGLALEDVGLDAKVFKKQYATFSDLPRPKAYKEFPTQEAENSQIEVQVFSKDNPIKCITAHYDPNDLVLNGLSLRFEEDKLFIGADDAYLSLDERDQHFGVRVLELEGNQKLNEALCFISKGAKAMLCCHFGGPSPRLTEQFRKRFLEEEEEGVKLYNLLALVGASYFEKCGEGEASLARLHKVPPPTRFSCGLVSLVPYEGVEEMTPQVDMVHHFKKHSESQGATFDLAMDELKTLLIANTSSNEHQVLKEVFQGPYAISSVKLLQLAHDAFRKGQSNSFSLLTKTSFPEASHGISSDNLRETLSAFFEHDNWGYAYFAPGNEEHEEGALLISPQGQQALIVSGDILLHGGEGTASKSGQEEDPFPLDLTWDPSLYGPLGPFMQGPNNPYGIGGAPSYAPQRPYFNLYYYFSPDVVGSRTFDTPQYPVFPTESLGPANSWHSPYPGTPSYFSDNISLFSSDIRPNNKSWMSQVADPVDTITGAFYIDEQDLCLMGSFPLAISRNYNSQNLVQSHLGWGWKLSVDPFLVEQEGKLFAAESDGTVICYTWNEEAEQYEVLAEHNKALYNFNAQGVGSSNTLFHNTIKDNVLYGADGSKRFFKEGLLQWWDNYKGDRLTFFYEERQLVRIENDQGNFCGFNYGYGGRVCEVYTRDGARVFYKYNVLGELTHVVLPSGATLTYEYDHHHHILRETRPHGQVIENIYDAQSRVIEQRAAMGQAQAMTVTAKFEYSPECTIVRDAAGARTTYHLFDQQIYKVEDPLGGLITQSWFIDESHYLDGDTGEVKSYEGEGAYKRSLKCTVDKRGLATSYHYDSRGNATKVTMEGQDLDGAGKRIATKQLTFNEQDLCVVEQVGACQTQTEYDNHFSHLPRSIKSYSGETLVSMAHFTYDDRGMLTRQDRNGSVTCFEYNDQGLMVKKIEQTGTSDPDVITHYRYNYQGLCREIIGIDSIERKTYDIMGRVITSKVFSLDEVLLEASFMQYDLNGQLISKRGLNDNHATYYEYHPSGQVKAMKQRLGGHDDFAYTLYEYDACGYLVEEVDPRGYCTDRSYDKMGHVLTETKEGVTTHYAYEAGGLIASMTDGIGARVERMYTTNGLLKAEVYPDTTCRAFVYDELGRAIEETVKGVTWQISYDDAHHLEIRTHAASNAKEVRQFDSNKNLISTTDPAGYIVEKKYDGLGRMVEQTSASGEVTRWHYLGNQVECLFASGERSVQVYEAGRCVHSASYDNEGRLIEQTVTSYDANTSVEEVVVGERVKRTWRNAAGQPLRIDQAECITEYEYDKCGNCIAIHDGEGRIERQLYDGLGRLICKRYGNGRSAHFTYDAASNVVKYQLPGSQYWQASYDSMGRKIHEQVSSDGETFNQWEYTYSEGALARAVDPMGREYRYHYDELGRLEQEDVEQWQRRYSYDERGLMTCLEQTGPSHELSWLGSFVYSPESRSTKVERAYDSEGRICYEAIYNQDKLVQESHQDFSRGTRALSVNGYQYHFAYQHGQLSRLSSEHTTCHYEYDDRGALEHVTLADQMHQTLHYANNGLPEQISTHFLDEAVVEQLAWSESGRLSEYRQGEEERHFSYTERGFLSSDGQQRYEFDLTKQEIGLLTKTRSWQVEAVDSFGRPTEEGKAYLSQTSYDPMGQTVAIDNKQCIWNPWGQLIEVRGNGYTWSATYDALGRRIETKYAPTFGSATTTQTFFDPESEFGVIGERVGDNAFWLLKGARGVDVIEDSQGHQAFLIKNTLGELTGVLVEGKHHGIEQEGSAFGPHTPSYPASDLFSYATSLVWHDRAVDPTGFIWMGKRHYDPMRGRFLSVDPLGYPLSLDLYGYAGGDPINYMDLDGRCPSPIYGVLGATTFDFMTSGLKLPVVNLFNAANNLAASMGWVGSHSYQVGSHELGNTGIYMINGIANTFEDARGLAIALSDYSGGGLINGVYNSTNNVLFDVLECGLSHLGGKTDPVQQLKDKWWQFRGQHGPNAKLLQYCHSGGATKVLQALESVPEALRQQIIVVAIAPASIIPDHLCFQSHNYMSKRDLVPRFDLMGHVWYRDQLKVLTPHPDAKFFDHGFLSPTFAPIIQKHMQDYLATYGKTLRENINSDMAVPSL